MIIKLYLYNVCIFGGFFLLTIRSAKKVLLDSESNNLASPTIDEGLIFTFP